MEIKNLQASRVFAWLTQTDKRINFLVGGRNSTKSWSIALHLLINIFFGDTNKRILVIRKTRISVKKSCFQLMVDFLRQYDCIKYVDINKSELEITRKDGSSNSILFTGLDDVDKLKSLEQGNYIWVEEGIDITFRDYINLDILMRRQTDKINQMFISLNPISALSWVKTEIVDKPDDDVAIHYSTIEDNPFASDTDRKRLDRLKDIDYNLYKIFRQGKWGILENVIYSGFKIVDIPKWQTVTYGLDFGYNHPSCLVKIYWKDDRFISQELLYESGLTNPQLIDKVKRLIKPKDKAKYIFADSAEPARIEEFYKQGFNIQPAHKSVTDGIDYVRAHSSGITKDSNNGIKEKQSYKYKQDKNGNVLDEPVKFNDDFCDAERYGTFTYSRIVIPEVSVL